MQVRYYDDPRSGQPHIYGHNVAEYEVEAVLDRPMEDRPGEGRSENHARENGHRPLFTSRLCSRSHSELGLCDHMFGPKSGLNRSILDFKAGFEFGRQLAYKLQQSAVGSFHVQASPARRRDFLGRHGHRKALSDAIRGSQPAVSGRGLQLYKQRSFTFPGSFGNYSQVITPARVIQFGLRYEF